MKRRITIYPACGYTLKSNEKESYLQILSKAEKRCALQPISGVRWIKATLLKSNTYNPNHVFSPEMKLLKISILETGWTQPIVITPGYEIVDGFHRWTLGLKDKDVSARTSGLVPCVTVDIDESHRRLATIRHNRARGQHGVVAMSEILHQLKKRGMKEQQMEVSLGMESEEVTRLMDLKTSPDRTGRDSFGRGWKPKAKTVVPKAIGK